MPVPIRQAAAELRIHADTLRAWVRRGAPVVLRGGRGRGNAAEFDVGALRAWHEGDSATLRAIAAAIPELLADAAFETFLAASGPHKRQLAGELGACWFRCATALLDRLRTVDAEIPELSARWPEKIVKLRLILDDSGTVGPTRTHRNSQNG